MNSNQIKPRIETLKQKKLVGTNLKMSIIRNKTGELWGTFGPRIKDVKHIVGNDKISLQIYPPLFLQNFNPHREFIKWATVEVTDFKNIPDGMATLILEDGLYAVFDYKGSSADNSIFEYIFSEWLPNSEFTLDDRPHFEVLGSNYKNNDPNSEEEIWIPVSKD